MHKGYTLNYFLKFFGRTKNNQWTKYEERNDLKNGKAQFCAVGFAGAVDADGNYRSEARLSALRNFLGDNVEAINDNAGGSYSKLGKTPRARILKALRLRKAGKLDKVLGDE